MKRWVIDRHGADSLRIDDAPTPAPAAGEVLVRTAAVALNPRDAMMIENGMGLDLAFPFVPASDMAGVVEAVGRGVERFATGARVISHFMPDRIEGRPGGSARDPSYRTLGGFYPGVLAEHLCLPADWLVAAPDTLDHAEASTLPVAGLTAWFALVEQGGLRAGDTVLLSGTGGVALFALQIAVAHGARVIISSSSDAKLARAMALGATHGINSARDVVSEVLALTGGRGADHVLELVGGKHFAQSVAAVSVGGRISLIGLAGGLDVSAPTTPILLKAATIQGIVTGHRRALDDLVRAVDQIRLKPVIDRRYPFEELPAALEHLRAGPFGKVVIELPTTRI